MAFIVITRTADLLGRLAGIAINAALNPTDAQTELTLRVNDSCAMKNQTAPKFAVTGGDRSRRAAVNFW
ncbi:MAG: hypothetical protein AAB370_00005, partial [Verrucomicrobiota bacterium]